MAVTVAGYLGSPSDKFQPAVSIEKSPFIFQ